MDELPARIKIIVLICSLLLGGCATLGSENASVKADLAKMDLVNGFLVAGEKLYKTGQLDLAETQFLEVLDVEAVNVGALYRLGNIQFRKGNLPDALKYFNKIIDINPRHPRSHYNIAVINLMEAERHFKLYAATEDPANDLAKVTEILSDINVFATKKKTKKESKLDELWQALEHN